MQEIVLRFPISGKHMIDNNELKSHCAQYILPVGLVFGRVMIDDILQDRKKNPEVARLSANTRMVADPELDGGLAASAYASIVEVTTTDGRHLSCRVDHAKGTMENPLTPDEIHQKYLKLATTVTTAAHAEQIADVVARIEREKNVAVLAALLRNPKAPARTARRVARAKGDRNTDNRLHMEGATMKRWGVRILGVVFVLVLGAERRLCPDLQRDGGRPGRRLVHHVHRHRRVGKGEGSGRHHPGVPGGGLIAVQKVGEGASELGFGFPWTVADGVAGREPFKAALADVTPPVAIAAYASAAIAGSDPMKTGFEAFKLAIGGAIVPFIFVYHPALILQGPWQETVWIFFLASVCIILTSAALTGWFIGPTSWTERFLLCAAAMGLVATSRQVVIPAGILAIGLFLWQAFRFDSGGRRKV